MNKSSKGGSKMMPRLSSVVKRHPLVTFFVLSYALSWWPWVLYAFDLLPQPIAGFGPFLAAVLVLAITGGKAGIVRLLRRMVQWRVGLGWYAVALLLPVAIALAAAAFNVLLGARAPSAAELGGWTGLFSTFAILLLVPGLGGAWEEPGWRGYALTRLQARRSALVAGLILWVGVAVWHLPLMVVGEVHWSEPVFIFGFVIVFNWVFNNTDGSVFILMLMHATNNTISGSFISPMFSGADSVRDAWLYAALWCAAAIVVVVWAGPKHLSRKHRKQEEQGAARPRAAKPIPA
jgi:CAAX protease family protein